MFENPSIYSVQQLTIKSPTMFFQEFIPQCGWLHKASGNSSLLNFAGSKIGNCFCPKFLSEETDQMPLHVNKSHCKWSSLKLKFCSKIMFRLRPDHYHCTLNANIMFVKQKIAMKLIRSNTLQSIGTNKYSKKGWHLAGQAIKTPILLLSQMSWIPNIYKQLPSLDKLFVTTLINSTKLQALLQGACQHFWSWSFFHLLFHQTLLNPSLDSRFH